LTRFIVMRSTTCLDVVLADSYDTNLLLFGRTALVEFEAEALVRFGSAHD
jgi:hypothetical protein